MLAAWPTRTHSAIRLSDAVPPRLTDCASGSATIHSVYRSVVNVAIGDGLVSIASPATGGLPNGILVDLGPDLRTLGLRRGMPVTTAEERLGVPETGLSIDLARAVRWSPRLRPPAGGPRRVADRWRDRSPAAWAFAADRSATGGLGALLRDAPADADTFGIVERSRGLLVDLQAALLVEDRDAVIRATRGLIGLGAGLTPSGDDLVAGIEAALHALDAPMAGFLDGALADVTDRTTAVAATLLRHAAAGEFAEGFHALLDRLLEGDEEALPRAIDRAVAWGATSGTDSLLGVLVGLDIASATRGRPV